MNFDDERENHAGQGDKRQHANVLIRVLVELKVDGLRMQYGADELALGRVKTRANDNRQYFLTAKVALLDHLCATEEYMATVFFDVELFVATRVS